MTLLSRAYSEKRDYIRMRMNAPVTIQHAGLEIAATCRDLSSTGMQVELRAQLSLGAFVTVHIPSEHNALRSLDAEAEVVRVQDLGEGQQMLGLAILTMR